MNKVAVVLSGCGYLDGAEINEAVLTLLALEKQGCSYQCFAPNELQSDVINHLSEAGGAMPERRHMMIEAARIARGHVLALDEADASAFDALILPGGFGVAKSLSTLATQGADFEVCPDLLKLAQAFHQQNKPIGLICIAPVLAPKLLQKPVQVTIGHDVQFAEIIQKIGGIHCECAVEDIVIDETHKVVSTPAYMLANALLEANQGIEKLVAAVKERMPLA